MGLIFYHNRKKPQYQFYIAKMCGRISRSNRSTKSLSRKNTMGDFSRFFMCTIGMLSGTMLWNPLKPAPMFIDRGIHAQAIIFVLLRRTLRSWRGFGMIAMQAGTATGALYVGCDLPVSGLWGSTMSRLAK